MLLVVRLPPGRVRDSPDERSPAVAVARARGEDLGTGARNGRLETAGELLSENVKQNCLLITMVMQSTINMETDYADWLISGC